LCILSLKVIKKTIISILKKGMSKKQVNQDKKKKT